MSNLEMDDLHKLATVLENASLRLVGDRRDLLFGSHTTALDPSSEEHDDFLVALSHMDMAARLLGRAGHVARSKALEKPKFTPVTLAASLPDPPDRFTWIFEPTKQRWALIFGSSGATRFVWMDDRGEVWCTPQLYQLPHGQGPVKDITRRLVRRAHGFLG